MKSGLNIGLKQTQKIIMTQTLRQSIEMLQMTNLELSEKISQEFLENPLLEEITSPQESDSLEESLNENLNGDLTDGDDFTGKEIYDDNELQSSERNYDSEDKKRSFIENAVTVKESLKEHLLWQANMTARSENEYGTYEEIITMLDDNGFLQEESFNSIDDKNKFSILKNINIFDPVGCGAFSVKECLSIQAAYYFPEDMLFHKMIREHFNDIEKLDYTKIARSLAVSENLVIEMSKMLQTLNPFPGRSYSGGESRPVIPDIEVRLVDGEIIVTLNDDWIPGIKLNSYYINLLKKKKIEKDQKEYLNSKLQSAMALLKNISGRRDTILKVTTSIMNHQRDFLEKGPGHLKYLIHHDIAEEVNVHESTVSRVSSNKYVQTPWGVYELKYFFVSRLKNAGENKANDQSSDKVKGLIQNIISNEDSNNPLSDEEVVNLLKSEGITVARRTVAKYREILGIPASGKRKKINMIKS
jgi:RNA polymerase sigma-54 factor